MADIHEGHRERLKKRFSENGLDGFAPHEVLELMLFYAIPRRDTNAVAHSLIKAFGSFDGVLEADELSLQKIEGVGPQAAGLLTLFFQSYKYYVAAKAKKRFVLTAASDARDYVSRFFFGEKEEMCYLFCFDSANRLIVPALVSRGSVNATEVSARKIAELATRHNAVTVLLAHNHPGGLAMPSASDIAVTKKLFRILHELGIKLADHIIVTEDGSISLADCGCIYNIKQELGINV